MAFARDDEYLKALRQGTASMKQGGDTLKSVQPTATLRSPGATLGAVRPSSAPIGMGPVSGTSGRRAPLLADYLKAASGSSLGERVAGGLEKQAERLKSGTVTTGQQGQLGLQVQTGAPQVSQGRQDVMGAGIYRQRGGGPVTDFTGPSDETPRVPSLGSATLTQQQAQAKAQDVESKARAAGQEGGAQSLLQQQFGKGQTYTSGEQALDAAILGAQAGDRLGQLSRKYSDLYTQLGGRFGQAAADYEASQNTMLPGQTRTSVSQEEIDAMNAFREAQRAKQRDEEAQAERQTRWARDRVAPEDRVATISEERQAAMMGMTLEDWIAAGRPWG